MSAIEQHEVVWPLGRSTARPLAMSPRLTQGAPKRFGFMWGYAFRGDELFPLLQAALAERYPGSSFVPYSEFGNLHGHDECEVLAALPQRLRAAGVDALVAGIGAAGSGTPAVVRAARLAEQNGVPAVAIVASGFMPLANAVKRALGAPGLALAEYPGMITFDPPEVFANKVRTDVLNGVVRGLTAGSTADGIRREQAPEEPQPKATVFRGSFDAVQRYFDAREWSDGLPVVPPTRERVAAFLDWTARDPDEVIAVLAPELREATVWSVAVNAVMAGCLPEYMPILLAAVEAISDPLFRLQHAGSTPGWEPLVTISGALVDALGFNTGAGNMRIGRRANSSIGRFMRLYFRNVAGLRPSTMDKGSIGLNFNVAMAENETAVREIGWQPFRVDCGFAQTDNVVSVRGVLAVSMPVYSGGADPVTLAWPLLRYLEGTLGPRVANGFWYAHQHPLIQMSPSVARAFQQLGWGKAQIRAHLFRNAKAPAFWFEHYPLHEIGEEVPLAEVAKRCPLPAQYTASDDPNRMLPILVREEWTDIVVAGDPDRNQSRIYVNNHEHGVPVARRIVLPEDWRERLHGQAQAGLPC